MKVVVLGCLGMAGHVIRRYLADRPGVIVMGLARRAGPGVDVVVDALNTGELEAELRTIAPDFVVNCIGLLVKESDVNVVQAIRVNALLPHHLAELGERIGFRLIHISTDCVFSGKLGGYGVNSPTNAEDNYGKSKALGEVVDARNITIRTSIIGPELKESGTGLLDWFLKSSGSVKGYTLAFWNGVTTLELAKFVMQLLAEFRTGLIQLSVREKIAKADLLLLFKREFKVSTVVVADADYRVDKSLLCSDLGLHYAVPDYETMLGELHEYMRSHAPSYSHYGISL